MRGSPGDVFAFRLALAFGEPNPYRLLEQIPAPLLRAWEAYAVIEPWRLEDEPARSRTYAREELREKVRAQVGAMFAQLRRLGGK